MRCGAGGVGREAYDAALAAGITTVAFLDDGLSGSVVRGLPVQSPDEAEAGTVYLVGIADPQVRQRLSSLLDERGLSPASVIHPRSIIAPETTLGDGCLVLGGARVSSSVRIGSHVQVHYNATVGHDAVLRDHVTARVRDEPARHRGLVMAGSCGLAISSAPTSRAVRTPRRSVGKSRTIRKTIQGNIRLPDRYLALRMATPSEHQSSIAGSVARGAVGLGVRTAEDVNSSV